MKDLAPLRLSDRTLYKALSHAQDTSVRSLEEYFVLAAAAAPPAAGQGEDGASRSWASLFSSSSTSQRLQQATAAAAAVEDGGAEGGAASSEHWTDASALSPALSWQRVRLLCLRGSPLGAALHGFFGVTARPAGALLFFATLGTYVLLASMMYSASAFRALPGRNSWISAPGGRAAVGGAFVIGFLASLLAPCINTALHRLFEWSARRDLEWRFPLLAAELRRRRAVEELLADTPTEALLDRLREGAAMGDTPACAAAAAAAAAAASAPLLLPSLSDSEEPPLIPPPSLLTQLLGSHVPLPPLPPLAEAVPAPASPLSPSSPDAKGSLPGSPPPTSPAWEAAVLQALAAEDARAGGALQGLRCCSLDTRTRAVRRRAGGSSSASPQAEEYNRGAALGCSLRTAAVHALASLYILTALCAFVLFSLGKGEVAASMALLASLVAALVCNLVIHPAALALCAALAPTAALQPSAPLLLPLLPLSPSSTLPSSGALTARLNAGVLVAAQAYACGLSPGAALLAYGAPEEAQRTAEALHSDATALAHAQAVQQVYLVLRLGGWRAARDFLASRATARAAASSSSRGAQGGGEGRSVRLADKQSRRGSRVTSEEGSAGEAEGRAAAARTNTLLSTSSALRTNPGSLHVSRTQSRAEVGEAEGLARPSPPLPLPLLPLPPRAAMAAAGLGGPGLTPAPRRLLSFPGGASLAATASASAALQAPQQQGEELEMLVTRTRFNTSHFVSGEAGASGAAPGARGSAPPSRATSVPGGSGGRRGPPPPAGAAPRQQRPGPLAGAGAFTLARK